ncbi:hypothetical protein CRG98_033141 [Punica granatum]|uniref:Reverse transcriptase Ty1/copia-type domain-containing protein n=1 Tax=Punica granatum TaxID=22663 RepID=A0A2I0IRT7_PUNGR|nr:hypothetical protein CRG98_033141 [Punica granatum]
MQSEHSSKWELVMEDEMNSLMSNSTWELVELPKGKKALHNKWVYRIKEEADGSKRYKARLVVKGFQQKQASKWEIVKLWSLKYCESGSRSAMYLGEALLAHPCHPVGPRDFNTPLRHLNNSHLRDMQWH